MSVGAAGDAANWDDPRHYQIHVTWGPDGRIIDGWGVNDVPAHCPYKVGDWVVMHGYPGHKGHPDDPGRTGFRGFVLGHMGSTILRGLTDDGRQWSEYWGCLAPDGTPGYDNMCTCCPHPPRRVKPQQLSLLDLPGY